MISKLVFLSRHDPRTYRNETMFECAFVACASAAGWLSHRIDEYGHADRVFGKFNCFRYVEFKTQTALRATQAARMIDAYAQGVQYAIVRPTGVMLSVPYADDDAFFNASNYGRKIDVFAGDIKAIESVLRARA